ncbi:MAG: nuclear transport factor 2 family protein [Bacteroides graminisolvens]
MDRWAKGDPDGFIELSTDDVVYMDPFWNKNLKVLTN